MQFTQHIFLTGFMGCGKTTISKKLAKQLKLDFIDLDNFIQQSEGITIEQIFATKGEAFFRQKETDYLQKIIALKQPYVIALGGGTVCFNNTINLVKTNGILLYIELPPKTLFQRLENAKDKRPLIKGLKGNDLLHFIELKLKERQPFYQQAHITLNGLNLTPQSISFKLIDFQQKDN